MAKSDLVRAFIKSVWPPADLLSIAVDVVEAESFSLILVMADSGRDYFIHALSDPSLP